MNQELSESRVETRCNLSALRSGHERAEPNTSFSGSQAIAYACISHCKQTSRGMGQPGVLPQLPGLPTEENIRQCNTRTAARCTAGARRTGSRQRRSLCARRALPVSVFLRLPVLPLRSAAPSAGPAFRYGQRRRRRGTRRQRWGARFLRLDRALCAPEHRAILAAEPDELVLAFYRLEALFALAPAQLVLAERLPPGPRVLALLALAPLAVVLANGSAAALYARPPLALVVTDARAPCGVQPDR